MTSPRRVDARGDSGVASLLERSAMRALAMKTVRAPPNAPASLVRLTAT